jgi:hypothetical protein
MLPSDLIFLSNAALIIVLTGFVAAAFGPLTFRAAIRGTSFKIIEGFLSGAALFALVAIIFPQIAAYVVTVVFDIFLGSDFFERPGPRPSFYANAFASLIGLLVVLWSISSLYFAHRESFAPLRFAMAVLSVIAMPIAATQMTQIYSFVLLYTQRPNEIPPPIYSLSSARDTECIDQIRDLGFYYEDPIEAQTEPGIFITRETTTVFWADAMLRALSFDGYETFGCSLLPLQNNPNNLFFSACVTAFKAFISLTLIAVLIYPFAGSSGRRARN